MNVLLLSDIHSNFVALEAVIQDAEANFKIDDVWVLGDLVGYGPDPAECLALLDSIGAISVAGNHDLAVAGAISTERFNHLAAAAVTWTRSQLDQSFLDQLGVMHTKLVRHDITLVHGSPRDPVWEYVIDALDAGIALGKVRGRGVVVGHTHIPAIFEDRGDGVVRIRITYSEPYSLVGSKFVLNPGSVGQPRDNDPRASYAVLNLETTEITHNRVAYDIWRTIQKFQQTGLPEFLASRLVSGI